MSEKKKKISAKRLKDKEMLRAKTRKITERVRMVRKVKEEIGILESAGIVPEGKSFARVKTLHAQKQFLALRDEELVEAYYNSYRKESKHGRRDRRTLRETGVAHKRGYLYFTEIARYCPREVFFRLHLPHRARDYSIKGLMLFDDGKLHHREAFSRLESEKLARNPERELILPETGAVGYYDWLVPVGFESGWQICDMAEFKSKLPGTMDRIAQEDYDQAQLYKYASMFCPTLKRKMIKIRKIRIFYRDRALLGESPAVGWIVDTDSDRIKELVSYARWLHKTVIEERYLCPQPYLRDSSKCQLCRFNDFCWRGYPAPSRAIPAPAPGAPAPPEIEILESHGKRFLELLKEIKKLGDEKDEISELFLNYFQQTGVKLFPVTEDKALIPFVQTNREVQKEQLLKLLGPELFSAISNPAIKLIEAAIAAGKVPAELVQQTIKYKDKAPYLKVTKYEEQAQDEEAD